jgi:hypothetical protein
MTKDQWLVQCNLLSSRIATFFSHEKHLHTASFAKSHEVKHLLSPTVDGTHLLLGESMYNHVLRVQTTDERQELGNLLACGPTGCGKSMFLISQLLTWPHSAIVNDIKGELFAMTAGYRAKIGRVFVVDPRGVGNHYDPLHGRETEDKLYALAKHLLYEPQEKDPIFTLRAIKMLTQIFLAARVENRAAGYEKYRLLPYVRPLLRLELKDVARKISAVSPELAFPFLDGKIGNKRSGRSSPSWVTSSTRILTRAPGRPPMPTCLATCARNSPARKQQELPIPATPRLCGSCSRRMCSRATSTRIWAHRGYRKETSRPSQLPSSAYRLRQCRLRI